MRATPIATQEEAMCIKESKRKIPLHQLPTLLPNWELN